MYCEAAKNRQLTHSGFLTVCCVGHHAYNLGIVESSMESHDSAIVVTVLLQYLF